MVEKSSQRRPEIARSASRPSKEIRVQKLMFSFGICNRGLCRKFAPASSFSIDVKQNQNPSNQQHFARTRNSASETCRKASERRMHLKRSLFDSEQDFANRVLVFQKTALDRRTFTNAPDAFWKGYGSNPRKADSAQTTFPASS